MRDTVIHSSVVKRVFRAPSVPYLLIDSWMSNSDSEGVGELGRLSSCRDCQGVTGIGARTMEEGPYGHVVVAPPFNERMLSGGNSRICELRAQETGGGRTWTRTF